MAETKSTIYLKSCDPYSWFGLSHFNKKFNIAISSDELDSDISIIYSQVDSLNSKIKIVLCTNTKENICQLSVDGQNIPLLIQPQEQSGDQILGKIVERYREYPCITISCNQIRVGFDIFKLIGKILAGEYDAYFSRTDELGKTLRKTPVVDILEEVLFSAINKISSGLIQRFAWPDNHKFAMVLTHDVDLVCKSYQYVPSILNSLFQLNWTKLRYHISNLIFKHGMKNPFWTFATMRIVENQLAVKSTYYFLNQKGHYCPFNIFRWFSSRRPYRIKNTLITHLIRDLDDSGFEIGMHGSFDSYKKPELLKHEKSVLESIVGREIRGNRQHYLNYDNAVTPCFHAQSGFQYDSSIGCKPGVGIGYQRGTSFPFHVMLPDKRVTSIVELPLLAMDAALLPEAAISNPREIFLSLLGKYPHPSSTIEEIYQLLETVEKHRGVFTVLWHTNTFNDDEYPGMIKVYQDLIIEARKRGAWIVPACETYDWVGIKGDNR